MEDQSPGSSSMRFLSFTNDKEDAEKEAKLKEAALRIEQAIERQKSLNELIDYKSPPEEEIDLNNDTRSLYDRLLEQKNRKQEALEESQKLSNLVTKLDEDEANYLNEVAQSRQEEEIRKRLEVYDYLEEKKRISERKIIEQEKKLKESFLGLKTRATTTTNNSLKSKLSSVIRVKPKPKVSSSSPTTTMVAKDQKPSRDTSRGSVDADLGITKRQNENDSSDTAYNSRGSQLSGNNGSHPKRLRIDQLDDREQSPNNTASHVDPPHCNCVHRNDVMRCIGVLPSLPLVDEIPDSSDSDNSDDNMNPRIVPRIGGSNK